MAIMIELQKEDDEQMSEAQEDSPIKKVQQQQ
jgi:hypothetical protein